MLSTAELMALALSAAKNDEPKASTQINEKLSSVKNPLIELGEKLKERKQDLETTKEHLSLYRTQLQPVEEVFSQVEECAAEAAPVTLEEEELGKVDVSCQWTSWVQGSYRVWKTEKSLEIQNISGKSGKLRKCP